jgi:hypothetical protein
MSRPKLCDDREDAPPDAEKVRVGLPDPDWTRDELCARAVWEYQRIDKGETYSPRYWFLGTFLREVRHGFGVDLQGWNDWRLRARLANRTRCERSMLLARAFDSPDELEHVPVLAALALAAERLGLAPRQSTADARLRRRLASLAKTLKKCLDEFAEVKSADGLGWRIAEVRQFAALLNNERIALERGLSRPVPKRRLQAAKPLSSATRDT